MAEIPAYAVGTQLQQWLVTHLEKKVSTRLPPQAASTYLGTIVRDAACFRDAAAQAALADGLVQPGPSANYRSTWSQVVRGVTDGLTNMCGGAMGVVGTLVGAALFVGPSAIDKCSDVGRKIGDAVWTAVWDVVATVLIEAERLLGTFLVGAGVAVAACLGAAWGATLHAAYNAARPSRQAQMPNLHQRPDNNAQMSARKAELQAVKSRLAALRNGDDLATALELETRRRTLEQELLACAA